jgi:hypothetical protein
MMRIPDIFHGLAKLFNLTVNRYDFTTAQNKRTPTNVGGCGVYHPEVIQQQFLHHTSTITIYP